MFGISYAAAGHTRRLANRKARFSRPTFNNSIIRLSYGVNPQTSSIISRVARSFFFGLFRRSVPLTAFGRGVCRRVGGGFGTDRLHVLETTKGQCETSTDD